MATISERTTALETDMKTVKDEVALLKQQIGQMATKDDLAGLKVFFQQRDESYTKNMWKLIFSLIGVMVVLLGAAFGIPELGKMFGVG